MDDLENQKGTVVIVLQKQRVSFSRVFLLMLPFSQIRLFSQTVLNYDHLIYLTPV